MENLDPLATYKNQNNLEQLLQQCENDRLALCDTVLRLMPSRRDIPVCSLFVARLKVLQDMITCSLNKYPVETCNMPQYRQPIRVFQLEVDADAADTFYHLIECLHKPNCKLYEYVAGPVRSQGYILPLFEMALSYDYISLANVCRHEMGFLVRELLDTDSLPDALSIIEMLAKRYANTYGEDGSFECQSGSQLKRHPVVRQCMHYLRASKYDTLVSHQTDLAKLPSITLIYLIIFAGMEYEQKRALFARALKQRATSLIIEFHQEEERLKKQRGLLSHHHITSDQQTGTNWDRAIVNFAASPEEEIISSILTQWAQTHRPLTRSRSADSRPKSLSKIRQVVTNTRHRAESMPPLRGTLITSDADSTYNTPPNDPMDICSEASVFSVAPIVDFGAMLRLPSISTTRECSSAVPTDSSLTISTSFILGQTNSGNYVSKEAFYPLPQSLRSLLFMNSAGALVISMHTNNQNTELFLIGTIANQSMFSTINVSVMADIDTDPYMDENPPVGIEPKPTHFAFRYQQPSVLVKKGIKIPQYYYTVHRANHPTTMNVCVYIKCVFTPASGARGSY